MPNHRHRQNTMATLCMEVYYPYHSHLIGRSGGAITKVMQATGTKIHFPDQNRIAGQRKSNRVAIRGRAANIEEARHQIRRAIPVDFMVDCSIETVAVLGRQALYAHFKESYGVLLRFYPGIDGVSCQVNLRGSYEAVQRLKEAVHHFCRIARTFADSVVMKLETSFDHAWLLRGHVKRIITESGAGIRCPDLSDFNHLPKRYSIWIRGSLNSVYAASLLLNDYLPLQLMYQAPGNLNEDIKRLAEMKDVLLRMDYSAPESPAIRISTYEKNAASLFEVRRICLRLPKSGTIPSDAESSRGQLDDSSLSFCTAVQQMIQQVELNKSSKRLASENPSLLSESLPSPSSTSSFSGNESIKGEQWIPASLSAARFDVNSFRHLTHLLQTLGLSHYTDLFLENEIDLALFTTLTDENLLSIGVSAFGARKIMTSAIKELTY